MKLQHISRVTVRSGALLATIVTIGLGLAAWKRADAAASDGDPAATAEPIEIVTEAMVMTKPYRPATTSIGTVLATRSVSLRNEVPGTVRRAALVPGRVVDAGAVLVALDVSVEEAELRGLQARADLAEATLARVERMAERRAVSAMELDNARAEVSIARAEIERVRAVIARKTIRAPFRSRIGIADVHPGQFLDAGALLTTLQGIDDAAHVDFAVAQNVAAGLRADDPVEVLPGPGGGASFVARIVAVDARVDPSTRNAMVRARIDSVGEALRPGASVRVRVGVGEARPAVVVPASALRKGPAGDHVFVLETGTDGGTRAHVRQVEAGAALGDEVVILTGLTAGERVAASGSFKLREGVLVDASRSAVAAGSPEADESAAVVGSAAGIGGGS